MPLAAMGVGAVVYSPSPNAQGDAQAVVIGEGRGGAGAGSGREWHARSLAYACAFLLVSVSIVAMVGACSEAGSPVEAESVDPASGAATTPEPPAPVAPDLEPRPLLPPPTPFPPGAFALESELVAAPVDLDLVASPASMWIDREFGRLDFGPGEQRRLTNGWHRAQPAKEATPGFVDSRGRASAIELPIAELADRTLELDLETFDAPDRLPNQVVRVVWNGFDLGRHVLDFGAHSLSIALPRNVQRLGLNRLRLEPLYWVSGAEAGVSRDRRQVGFKLAGLRLVGGSEAGSSQPVGVTLADGRMLQACGSIVSWHRMLPDDARLTARLGWEGDAAPASGRVRIAVSRASGEQVVLADHPLRTLASGDGVALDLDLGAFAGEIVAIEATVTPGPGEGAVAWGSPRLAGTRHERAIDASSVRAPYDVLVLVFDTLRADHLAAYGNEVVETPYLDALAASGFTFAQAGSNASWTRPSVASLWTGLHPWAHRVTSQKASVPAGAPYLPEILSGSGWATVGVSTNAHFSNSFGFGRGFDDLFEYYRDRQSVVDRDPSPEAQAAHIWGSYVEPAIDAAGEKPVFGVVHEIDPHSPYEAPEPYASLYDFGYEGNIDGWDARDMHQAMRVIDVVNAQQPWLGEADRRAMRAAYMAEVSLVDAYVGALLGHLEASGRRERTLVVFVSDHGEQFFEHGGWGHGRSLYQEEVAVPLIFSLPGVIPAGLRSDLPVELVDVAPTILDLLGVEAPPALQGRSLLPDMLAGPEARAAISPQFATSNTVILARGRWNSSSQAWDSVRLGRWKLHRSTHRRMRQPKVDYELYDLERDPDEVLDLWASQPVVGHALRQMLEGKLESDARIELEAGTVEDIDSDVLDNLRGLGYVE